MLAGAPAGGTLAGEGGGAATASMMLRARARRAAVVAGGVSITARLLFQAGSAG